MARSPSIRRSLLANLTALVVVLGVAIGTVTWLGSRRALRALSGALLERSTLRTESELHRFLDPVSRGLAMARSWGRSGMLPIGDPEALTDLFVPLIREHPQISSILVADERGREHMLLHTGEGWVSRRDEGGDAVRWAEWTDDPDAARVEQRRLDYDPRRRPWFRGAVERSGQVHWTRPYTFFTTGDPGMTASVTFDAGDGVTRVVGFDVLLREISGFTSRFRVSRRGLVLLLSEDRRVLGLPARLFDDPGEQRRALLRRPAELGLPLVDDALEAVARAAGGAPAAGEGAVRFRSGGEPWWGARRAFPLDGGREITIAVLVPEADLLGALAQQRLAVAGIVAAVLALAVLQAVRMARRYSRPIEVLVAESDRISRGDLEPGPGVPSTLEEMDRLGRAHERMRESLRALLRLERDLRVARQIQEWSVPRRMPELEGYEIAAWSEPAEETGGDAYDVVGIDLRTGLPVEEGRAGGVALLLADATGHGVGPALSVTQVRAMLRMALHLGVDLARMVRHMNDQLCADLRGGRFITAWLGELDCTEHVLRSLSAGQAPILHWEAAAGRVHELPADTTPLGVVSELEVDAPRSIRLGPGDVVAVLSDGIYEAGDGRGGTFGVARVATLLRKHRRATARGLLEALRRELDAFAGGQPAGDDRTAVVVVRR